MKVVPHLSIPIEHFVERKYHQRIRFGPRTVLKHHPDGLTHGEPTSDVNAKGAGR